MPMHALLRMLLTGQRGGLLRGLVLRAYARIVEDAADWAAGQLAHTVHQQTTGKHLKDV